ALYRPGQHRPDGYHFQKVIGKLNGSWMAVGTDYLAEKPAGFERVYSISRQDAMGCNGRNALGAGVAIGTRGREQRAASTNHIVVDNHILVFDMCAHGGQFRASTAQSALEHERGINPDIVSQRLHPFRTP